MATIQLIHWKPEEAEERIATLESAGYQVDYRGADPPASMRAARELDPAAVVIDLGRLPSHGREVAGALRQSKKTRAIPLVFVGGDTLKVARIRAELPDAIYTTWSRIRSALKRAIAKPLKSPVVPTAHMDRYAGTPLLKKLGVKPNQTVVLLNAPAGFEQSLGSAPEGVKWKRQLRGPRDLILWFVTSRRELESRIDQVADRTGLGGLWIAWPKKASGRATEVQQADIRRIGLAAGMVDNKVCAIDETWSALRFTNRR